MTPGPVFPEWAGRSLDDILYECRELLEDTSFPTVRRWREAGGKHRLCAPLAVILSG